ncbi:unnamed protein product [Blepharisma stoltei]|uniref:Uncharacterized protein n=1 Tax=Blepharisma stoltei TaxID=1481888 RepID=A0AAU9IF33_9CILI|nr:unnamed protein product [Blepharisma stoltei]
MKSPLSIIRKSDRLKFCSHDILRDLFEILGPVALRIRRFHSKKNHSKPKKIKIRSLPKNLDGVLGLASFIREVEFLGPEYERLLQSRAATHLNIAKFIYRHLTGSN